VTANVSSLFDGKIFIFVGGFTSQSVNTCKTQKKIAITQKDLAAL